MLEKIEGLIEIKALLESLQIEINDVIHNNTYNLSEDEKEMMVADLQIIEEYIKEVYFDSIRSAVSDVKSLSKY